MTSILANQKPAKRRRPPFINASRGSRMKKAFSSLGTTFFDEIRAVFTYFCYITRDNPLVPKVIGVSVAFFVITGCSFLVYFAVSSPEMPPGNLLATLKDVSVHYLTPENSQSQLAILDSEEDWAIMSAFDGHEFGSGVEAPDRTQNIEYPVRPGETLSEIAYAYGISYDLLAWYNKISNANRIRAGTMIIIPSLDNTKKAESEFAQQRTKQVKAAAAPKKVKDIQISYDSRMSGDINGAGITVNFSIVNPPANLRSLEWDMGDGRRSFRENPSYEYMHPKTYVVRLTAQGSDGVIYKSNPLYIDVPHPTSMEEHSRVKFITLSSLEEYFVIDGTISAVAGYANVEAAPLDLSESDKFLTKVRFRRPGYYGVTVRKEGGREQYYSIFASPIATMHADMDLENFNWYRTQFNTGTPSNCGPASVSMAIGWGTSKYYPVSSVRQAVGWQGEGGTSFEELLKVIRNQGVSASIAPLRSVQNVRDVIDSGAIAIILFHTSGIKTVKANPATDLFGKYYNDSVGHYAVVKGYSLNGEYLVIHDPIPSDWGANSFRYGDEISMIGRNRYYSSAEILRSLRRADMIVINQASGN
ncbi:MAG: LysM peptidoglycan-binding domain-containing protein [Treponema sp.]|jgi:PKD repeat protein|nr:LysM peptidoglycan-binding domain-containing protein [Treponema sp.]